MMSEIEVYHLPSLDTSSRAKRAAEAASILSSVAGACHDYVSENRPEPKDDEEDDSEDSETQQFDDSDYDEVDSIADQCENDSGEVEAVDFPSMYG
jgi:hypothetical protein